MKKNNKKKKKNNQKLMPVLVGVIAIILLISGGTYAYWQWISGNNTVVNFTVTGATMTITGSPITTTNMVPIKECYKLTYDVESGEHYVTGSGATVNNVSTTTVESGKHTAVSNFTVTATNETSSKMAAILVLKARFTAGASAISGASLTAATLSNLKWAISEVSQSNLTNYSSTNCTSSAISSTLGGIQYGSGDFYLVANNTTTTNTPTYITQGTTGQWVNIHTAPNSSSNTTLGPALGATSGNYLDIWFEVPAKQTITKYYQVYVWLDDAYVGPNNIGTTVNDPMQGATIEVTFANNKFVNIDGSRIEQLVR